MTINEIIQGSALEKLKELESESIDCCITSPPYWALRDYKSEPQIWDSLDECEHDWNHRDFKLHSGRGDATKAHEKYSGLPNIPDTELTDSYCSKCNAWRGSLGLEPTFDLYIKHLIEIFNEVKRVLKKTGSCWVNMGDTYNNSEKWGGQQAHTCSNGNERNGASTIKKAKQVIPQKSLCLIPQRFQIAMVENQWICRNTVIWYKPNCMPSSAKDRFTVDFEYLFFFTKSQRYFFDTQYEPLDSLGSGWEKQRQQGIDTNQYKTDYNLWGKPNPFKHNPIAPFGGNKAEGYENRVYSGNEYTPNGLGRIKRCVWKIPTQPFSEAHFAVFPEKLVETPLKATCPEYVCKKCGKAREKIVEKEYEVFAENISHRKYFENPEKKAAGENKEVLRRFKNLSAIRGEKILGYNECNCNAGFSSGVCLDPFMGSGTTAIVAMQNARNFVGIELNPEYIKMAYERLEPYLKQQRMTEFA